MPKLDLSKVPVVLRAVYPGGFLDEQPVKRDSVSVMPAG